MIDSVIVLVIQLQSQSCMPPSIFQSGSISAFMKVFSSKPQEGDRSYVCFFSDAEYRLIVQRVYLVSLLQCYPSEHCSGFGCVSRAKI